MPRYFYHVADGAPVADSHGSNLPDDQAARGEALRYAGEILKWSTDLLTPSNQLRVSVTSEDRVLLFTVVTVVVDVPKLQRVLVGTAAND